MTYRGMIETIAEALGRRVMFVRLPLWPVLQAVRCYQAVARRPRVTTETIQRFGEDRAFDISAAQRDLGFAPIPFEQGIRRQIAGEIDAVWAEATQDGSAAP
jgi:nucleoside-diphosphate-sugar epimerase